MSFRIADTNIKREAKKEEKSEEKSENPEKELQE